jgi:uncharacterized cupin superfamily protein
VWIDQGAFVSPVLIDEWERLDDGISAGEVHWLRRSEPDDPLLSSGLWRHIPEEDTAALPYRVAGSETMYVVEGAAKLTLTDGSVIWLQPGTIASFADGFEAQWRTLEPFMKFFVVTD